MDGNLFAWVYLISLCMLKANNNDLAIESHFLKRGSNPRYWNHC